MQGHSSLLLALPPSSSPSPIAPARDSAGTAVAVVGALAHAVAALLTVVIGRAVIVVTGKLSPRLERGLLHLEIGRLEESLKKFDVPVVNDAVLKDASDIEHFDERKPPIRPPRRSSHVRRSSYDGLRRSALCGAAQRRHVQPTRRARVASAQFRAIRLACKRSAAAAAKSRTRSRTADRFLLLSLV